MAAAAAATAAGDSPPAGDNVLREHANGDRRLQLVDDPELCKHTQWTRTRFSLFSCGFAKLRNSVQFHTNFKTV